MRLVPNAEDSVSAADLVRRFGIWRERATNAPVVITNHGRGTHVLISRKAFEDISSGSDISSGGEAQDESFALLFDKFSECAMIIDQGRRVQRANTATLDYLRMKAEQVEAVMIEQLMPNIAQSFAYRNVIRALTHGESSATDAPSVHRPGLWLHIKTFPLAKGAAILFRDITADVQENRQADIKSALVRAMAVDGGIAVARISLREMVEGADAALCAMTGFTEEALRRVKFSTMIVSQGRADFHEALESVFGGRGPARFETLLFSNAGVEIPVRLSIVELRGDYASEGAIVVLSKL